MLPVDLTFASMEIGPAARLTKGAVLKRESTMPRLTDDTPSDLKESTMIVMEMEMEIEMEMVMMMVGMEMVIVMVDRSGDSGGDVMVMAIIIDIVLVVIVIVYIADGSLFLIEITRESANAEPRKNVSALSGQRHDAT